MRMTDGSYITLRGRTSPAVKVGWRMDTHVVANCMDGPRCKGPGCRLETGKTEKNRQSRNGK